MERAAGSIVSPHNADTGAEEDPREKDAESSPSAAATEAKFEDKDAENGLKVKGPLRRRGIRLHQGRVAWVVHRERRPADLLEAHPEAGPQPGRRPAADLEARPEALPAPPRGQPGELRVGQVLPAACRGGAGPAQPMETTSGG